MTEDNKAAHACYAPQQAAGAGGHGPAIEDCLSDEEGHFIAGNAEYASFVNFCPLCGEKAPLGIPQVQTGEARG